MAKSKIIKQFVNNEIAITETLERILILAQDMKDNNLIQWIKNEIQGYKQGDNIPEYRKIPITCIGTYRREVCVGLNIGVETHKNAVLPTAFLNKMTRKQRDNFLHKIIVMPIEVLEQSVKNNNEIIELISPEHFHFFEVGTSVEVLSAKKVCNVAHTTRIIKEVRVKIIDILRELEKEFGCLDDLDIEIDKIDKSKIQEIHNNIYVIIQDNHTDNSITMGDENKVSNSTIANNQN